MMTPARIILHGERGPGSLCADDFGPMIMLTTEEEGASAQLDLTRDDARRLGEWLIKRANEGGGAHHDQRD